MVCWKCDARRRHERCRNKTGLRHGPADSSAIKLQYLSVDTEGVTRDISCSYNPEAGESADEFRLLRCCGREMIALSSSLHDPKETCATRYSITSSASC